MSHRNSENGSLRSSEYPLAYLITWTCYGTWLHGEERGSVDVAHNLPGTSYLAPDLTRRMWNWRHMDQSVYLMDEARRAVVLAALRQHGSFRGWTLHAVHVRTTHVHVVVSAEARPERILTEMKAYASRQLNQTGWDGADRKRWTRHGSTRYLWQESAVLGAIEYTLNRQGTPMSRWPEPDGETFPGGRVSDTLAEPRPQGSGCVEATLPEGRVSEEPM